MFSKEERIQILEARCEKLEKFLGLTSDWSSLYPPYPVGSLRELLVRLDSSEKNHATLFAELHDFLKVERVYTPAKFSLVPSPPPAAAP